MRSVDIAIIGAGLAGSLAAIMLGRAGYNVIIVDLHETFRPDFRCEKLEKTHVDALRKAALAEEVLPSGRYYEGVWVARRGRLCEHRPIGEYGLDYSALVNRLRAMFPGNVTFVCGKATGLALSADRQILTLNSGETISARLVVAASGLNTALLHACGMRRREISRWHSVAYGFDVKPHDTPCFPFSALTYYGEKPADRVSYITFFSTGSSNRVNLFVYREPGDPWLKRFQEAPEATIFACLPRLSRLTGPFQILGSIKPRPTDLYRTENVRQPGIVLVGDAYASACPISGTGASKGLVDVERLCHVHVPQWMASPGMGVEKIASFYEDEVKRKSDATSLETSLFAKRVALNTGLSWDAYRWVRFAGSFARGLLDRPRNVRLAAHLDPATS